MKSQKGVKDLIESSQSLCYNCNVLALVLFMSWQQAVGQQSASKIKTQWAGLIERNLILCWISQQMKMMSVRTNAVETILSKVVSADFIVGPALCGVSLRLHSIVSRTGREMQLWFYCLLRPFTC